MSDLLQMTLAALWRASWQGALVLALVWLLTRAWRRMPPVVRVWLWRVAIVKVLLALLWSGSIMLPAPAALPLPALPPPDLVTVSTPTPVASPAKILSPAPRAVSIPLPAPATVQPAPPPPIPWQRKLYDAVIQTRETWLAGLGLLWLLGMLSCCAGLVCAWRGLRRVRHTCCPVSDDAVTDMLAELTRRFRVSKMPALLASDGMGPLLFGTCHPAIIIPRALLAAEQREPLRLVLAHELAHLRRQDLRWGWLAAAADVLFFFHPLVRLGVRELSLAQEVATDALVLHAATVTAPAYRAMLLAVTTVQATHRPVPVALGVSESFHTLHLRLSALTLGGKLTRRRAIVLGGAICVLVGHLSRTSVFPTRCRRSTSPPSPLPSREGGAGQRKDVRRQDISTGVLPFPRGEGLGGEVERRHRVRNAGNQDK